MNKPPLTKALLALANVSLFFTLASDNKFPCEFRKVDGLVISADEVRNSEEPLVLTGVVESWDAWGKWNGNYIKDQFGNLEVTSSDLHLGNIAGKNFTSLILSDILTGSDGAQSLAYTNSLGDGEAYFFLPSFALSGHILSSISLPTSVASVRDQGPSISLGLSRSYGTFHRHREAWHAQLHGKKLWLVAPPETRMFQEAIMTHPCDLQAHSESLGILQCTARAGEIVYLPDGWHHALCNHDDPTVGVAFIGRVGSGIHEAAFDGKVETLQEFLKKKPRLRSVHDYQGRTPLHIAAYAGHTAVMEVLLSSRALVTERVGSQPSGAEPIHLAAKSGHVKVVTTILGKHDTIEQIDSRSRLASRPNLLNFAAGFGHTALTGLLLDGRADISAKGVHGRSALHETARVGHWATSKMLLDHGLNLDFKDARGFEPLHEAAYGGHNDVVSGLLAHRANVQSMANSGGLENLDAARSSPLHAAALNGHMDVVQELINGKADVNVKNARGETALFLAASIGWVGLVHILSSMGATDEAAVNIALSAARELGHSHIVDLLSKRQHVSNGDL